MPGQTRGVCGVSILTLPEQYILLLETVDHSGERAAPSIKAKMMTSRTQMNSIFRDGPTSFDGEAGVQVVQQAAGDLECLGITLWDELRKVYRKS